MADAAATVGWPLVDDGVPQWEWSRFHAGGVVELTFVLSDDGQAEVLLMPSLPDVDAELQRLCRQNA